MMLSTGTPFVDGPTTQDALPVIDRTSRSISRQVIIISHVRSLAFYLIFVSESHRYRIRSHCHWCHHSCRLNTSIRSSKKRMIFITIIIMIVTKKRESSFCLYKNKVFFFFSV